MSYVSVQKQPPEVFYIKGVIKNFTKFTGKHLWQSLFFKNEILAQVFSCEFCEIFKNTFLTEHLRLLLSVFTCHGDICYYYAIIYGSWMNIFCTFNLGAMFRVHKYYRHSLLFQIISNVLSIILAVHVMNFLFSVAKLSSLKFKLQCFQKGFV